MKIACFSMVRNESLLIESFLYQAHEFFDYFYILDHESSDNTVDVIQSITNTNDKHLYFLQATGQPQSEVATFFAHKIFNETDADYLFLLDADEYLPFDNRKELEYFLLKYKEADIIKTYWCNISPSDFNRNDIFSGSFLYSGTSKTNAKIILTKSVHKIVNWQVAQGNHSLIVDKNISVITAESDMPLYHIPIQNMTQLYLKMLSGTIRLQGSKILHMKGLGSHWETYAKFLSSDTFSNDDILNMIFSYGEPPLLSTESKPLEFTFPYITKKKNHDYNINGHLVGIIQQLFNTSTKHQSANYIITDFSGTVIDNHHISYLEWLLKIIRIMLRNNYYKMKAFVKKLLLR